MLLTSILINASGSADLASCPPWIAENIRSVRQHHPGMAHALFGLDRTLAFLQDKFPREVVDAFHALKPYAYKADLARYCILYEHGGLYADLSYCLLRPLPLDARRILAFRDFMWSSPWDTSNGVFACPPRHKVLALAIQMVCDNVRRRYFGPTALCPTGPALFGKALATACEPQDLIMGSAAHVERRAVGDAAPGLALPAGEKLHCLILDSEIVAVKRKRLGAPGLQEFGVADGNVYYEMWNRREVYDGPPVHGETGGQAAEGGMATPLGQPGIFATVAPGDLGSYPPRPRMHVRAARTLRRWLSR